MKHLSEAEYGQIQPFLDRNVMARVATKGGPGGPLAAPQNLQDCPVLVIILNMSTRDRKTLHSELKYCV